MNKDRFWILYSRKKAGEASPAELRELESMDESRHFSLEVMEKLWTAPLDAKPEMKAGADLWNKIGQRIGKSSVPVDRARYYSFPRLAAAACVLIAASAVFYFSRSYLAARHVPAPTALRTLATEQTAKLRQLLPDGTVVWLNRNSRLLYDPGVFGKALREVSLDGEAFFDVAHNAQVPFVIHAMNVNITVKGTAFNVRAYPHQRNVETSLLRGLIEITTREDPERKILVRPNEKILIPEVETSLPQGPVQQAPYRIDLLKKDRKQQIAETAWMQPRLEFDNESFLSLAPRLESWYGVSVHFEDQPVSKRRFTASIEKETLEETLRAMQLSYPFEFRRDGNAVYIKTK